MSINSNENNSQNEENNEASSEGSNLELLNMVEMEIDEDKSKGTNNTTLN